tara:strand:- start:425 stop:610 length:186 start_codon:yes stop_codon:yes gene_type:complete
MKGEGYSRFMWMRSPHQALDVIAEIVHSQEKYNYDSKKEQDAWLKACVELNFVDIELEEEE